jgi:soluble lytic murein transglycosylase-like protein
MSLGSLLIGVALAGAPWIDAKKVGDCELVLTQLDSPSTDVERLAAAQCATRRGRPEDGLTWLNGVEEPLLAPYVRLLRAESLLSAGRAAEALEESRGLSLPGRTGNYARLIHGRAGVEAERSLEVRETLRDLLQSEFAHEARYLLAVGGEQRGATEAARATYQRVWADATRGGWAELAAERLASMGHPVPDLSTEAGRALVQARIAALAADRQHDESLALRRLIASDSPPATGASKLALARATFKGRDYAAANALYREVLGRPEEATGAARDLYDYALGAARTGDYQTSTILYRRLMSQHPSDPRSDTGSYKIGYMAWDERRCEEAIDELSRHIATWPTSKHLDEALWFKATCLYAMGRVDDARQGWRRLQETRGRSSLVPGAAYWLARTEADADTRKASLAAVIRRFPTSGYAWFAAERTGMRFPTQAPAERPEWPSSLGTRTDVRRADLLLAAGFPDWAIEELGEVRTDVKSREGKLALAHALIEAGDYRGAKKLAAPYCVSPWKTGDALAQQACTPRPEHEVVSSMAGRYGLEPLLPYGIMTSESALDPSVTSVAGARGLMQLMPIEAARVHDGLYGWEFSADDLYLAPYNASLGTSELGQKAVALEGLLKGTSLPAVIASYNGGEEAVRRWREAWPDDRAPEADEWSEWIGYTETRRYVKGVLGHVMRYRWVYGDPPSASE